MSDFTFFYGNTPFSNWHMEPFEHGGIWFNCSEQAMMYAKACMFNDMDVAARILNAIDPRQQKALGREVKGYDNEVWNEHRYQIVYDICKSKFQNEDLKEVLLNTGDTILVEASPWDTVWGIGLGMHDPARLDPKNWKGLNLLGKVLTNLREEFLKETEMQGITKL